MYDTIQVMIQDDDELQKFRFFYMNIFNVDLSKDYMTFYFVGKYYTPCVVTLNDSNLRLISHQEVKGSGDEQEYLNSKPSTYYKKTISIKELFKLYE